MLDRQFVEPYSSLLTVYFAYTAYKKAPDGACAASLVKSLEIVTDLTRINMNTTLSEFLVFALFQTDTATGTVTSPAIVITLDIIRYCRSHYFPAGKALSVDTFHFLRVEEASRTGIIMTVTSGAHAATQTVPFQKKSAYLPVVELRFIQTQLAGAGTSPMRSDSLRASWRKSEGVLLA